MLALFHRAQPQPTPGKMLAASLGGMIAIGVLGAITAYSSTPLIMAPFGASCVLLFSVPNSPLSQPANVIGGHVVATLVGLLLRLIFPNEWWAVAIAVGLAIGLMAALRITHPPAGADPLVVFSTDPGFGFLLFPVLTGAIALVCVATAFHKLTRTAYPTGKS